MWKFNCMMRIPKFSFNASLVKNKDYYTKISYCLINFKIDYLEDA